MVWWPCGSDESVRLEGADDLVEPLALVLEGFGGGGGLLGRGAAFCCVIWSSWVTAVLTWPMPSDCSEAAAVISPMMSVTRCTEATISPWWSRHRRPAWSRCRRFSTEAPMRALISRAASAERWARCAPRRRRPRSRGPARRRGRPSAAALSARMLVWKAMPSMVPMMSEILRELALISSIVETTCDDRRRRAGDLGGRRPQLVRCAPSRRCCHRRGQLLHRAGGLLQVAGGLLGAAGQIVVAEAISVLAVPMLSCSSALADQRASDILHRFQRTQQFGSARRGPAPAGGRSGRARRCGRASALALRWA